MENKLYFSNKTIDFSCDVFTIAEVGINHNGDIKTAIKLIDKAKWAGASAVKFQTYITEKRVPEDSPIFGILKQCELSFDQQKELFEYANGKNIVAFSTPFDHESVQFLADINAPCFKVASFDLVNIPLLKDISKQSRPVIMSRGMANMDEIDTAMHVFKEGRVPVVLMHCVSAYPIPDNVSINLSTIQALKERYDCPIGYSDHTLGIEAAQFAVAAGAVAIEKHFTMSQTAEGPDHVLSSEPEQLKKMIDGCKEVRFMMGEPVWTSIEVEKETLQYRRKK